MATAEVLKNYVAAAVVMVGRSGLIQLCLLLRHI